MVANEQRKPYLTLDYKTKTTRHSD